MLAHCLTGLRLLLVIPTTLAFASPGFVAAPLLAGFLLVAIVTDVLDGKVARSSGTASAAGQLFDHTTDFLFVTGGLGGAAWSGLLTPWLPPLIIVAFAQYVLDSRFLHKQKQLRMSYIGRWNGILYFVPLVLLALAALDATAQAGVLLAGLAGWFSWALVASTLVSIVDRALAREKAASLPQRDG